MDNCNEWMWEGRCDRKIEEREDTEIEKWSDGVIDIEILKNLRMHGWGDAGIERYRNMEMEG